MEYQTTFYKHRTIHHRTQTTKSQRKNLDLYENHLFRLKEKNMKRCDFESKLIENHPLNKKMEEKPIKKIKGNLLDNKKMKEKTY